jgi:chromosomal replication initiation ATPase DnaA
MSSGIQLIVFSVASEWDVELDWMISGATTHRAIEPRRVAWVLASEHGHSHRDIARAFGMSAKGVGVGIKAMRERLKTEGPLAQRVRRVRVALRGAPMRVAANG